jgi:1,4-alpha-glucan branching enzyme
VEGRHENPFEILGPHEVTVEGRRAVAVRAYLPHSAQAWVLDKLHGNSRPMRRIHPAGLFEAICPLGEDGGSPYLLRVADPTGRQSTMHDPYAFPPLLSDYDLHLLHEGRHWQSYHKLGAHLRSINGVDGVNFAVWAPNATGVSIVGDFNSWDGRRHPMRKHIPSGIWELFVPSLGEGTLYKFQVRNGDSVVEKSDPYGFAAEVPPRTASKVVNLDNYAWNDGRWMAERQQRQALDAPDFETARWLAAERWPGRELFVCEQAGSHSAPNPQMERS